MRPAPGEVLHFPRIRRSPASPPRRRDGLATGGVRVGGRRGAGAGLLVPASVSPRAGVDAPPVRGDVVPVVRRARARGSSFGCCRTCGASSTWRRRARSASAASGCGTRRRDRANYSGDVSRGTGGAGVAPPMPATPHRRLGVPLAGSWLRHGRQPWPLRLWTATGPRGGPPSGSRSRPRYRSSAMPRRIPSGSAGRAAPLEPPPDSGRRVSRGTAHRGTPGEWSCPHLRSVGSFSLRHQGQSNERRFT